MNDIRKASPTQANKMMLRLTRGNGASLFDVPYEGLISDDCGSMRNFSYEQHI